MAHEVEALIQRLEAALEELDHQRTELMLDMEAAQRVRELLAIDPADDEPISHGPVTPADIENCKTQMAALRLMAMKNDGLLLVTAAARVMLAAGLSSGQLPGLRATVNNRLTEGDDWEYVKPGIFRWNPQRTADDYVNDWQGELSEPHPPLPSPA